MTLYIYKNSYAVELLHVTHMTPSDSGKKEKDKERNLHNQCKKIYISFDVSNDLELL